MGTRLRRTIWRWYRATPTAEVDARFMARSLGTVGAAAATLGLLWVLLPSPPQSDRPALVGLGLVGELSAGLLLSGWLDTRPRVVFEGAVALATLLISAAEYFARVRGTGIPFLYLWCTLYAYWFFPRGRALLQGVLVVVGYAVATFAASHVHPQLAGTVGSDWGPIMLLAGTVLVTGELVRRLGLTIAESHQRFATMFARAPTPMARVDLRTARYLDANEAFCRAIGCERAEVIGTPMRRFAPEDQRMMVLERVRALLAGQPVEPFERDYVRPDGTRVTLLVAVSLLGEPSEPGVELFIQALDLTARKQAERALAASEQRYRTLIETSQAVVWASDASGRFTFLNDAVRSVLGYAPAELVGRRLITVLPDSLRSTFFEEFAELMSTGFQSGELAHKRRDGTLIMGSYSVAALRDGNGEVTGYTGTVLDVTESRRAAEALRLSEARLRMLIEYAPAAIIIRDRTGRLTTVNREGARLLGRPAEQLVGSGYEGLLDPRDALAMRESDGRVLAGHAPELAELTLHLPGGDCFVLTAAVPLPGAPGEGPSVCRICFDVTDRERARQALVRSNEERRRLLAELVRAQEAERRRIAADVHDESIQVLAGVAIRLGLLSGMLDRPEQQRLIAGLDESVRHGIRGLRQLLFDLRLPALDELGLAAAVRSYISETIAPEGTTYSVEDHLLSEPPDEVRTVLYRVAQEALANVRKHAHARHVEVVLTETEDEFRVLVRDDGVGFATGDAAEVPGHLGLVGMRERIDATGGWIDVRSEPGQGTAVAFGVPLRTAVLASASPATASER